MNFFKKKDHIFIIFVESELQDSERKLRENLLGLLPLPPGTEVKVNISDARDLSLKSLSVFLSFASRLRQMGVHLHLMGHPNVIDNIQMLDFGGQFDALQKEEKPDVH